MTIYLHKLAFAVHLEWFSGTLSQLNFSNLSLFVWSQHILEICAIRTIDAATSETLTFLFYLCQNLFYLLHFWTVTGCWIKNSNNFSPPAAAVMAPICISQAETWKLFQEFLIHVWFSANGQKSRRCSNVRRIAKASSVGSCVCFLKIFYTPWLAIYFISGRIQVISHGLQVCFTLNASIISH